VNIGGVVIALHKRFEQAGVKNHACYPAGMHACDPTGTHAWVSAGMHAWDPAGMLGTKQAYLEPTRHTSGTAGII
jgi:hypothetical protein